MREQGMAGPGFGVDTGLEVSIAGQEVQAHFFKR
jgi:hypothetical protein